MITKKEFLKNFSQIIDNLNYRCYSSEFINKVEKIKNQILLLKQIQDDLEKKQEQRNILIKKKENSLEINKEIENLEKNIQNIIPEINDVLYNIPNYIDSSVPFGKNEKENKIIKIVGQTEKKTIPHYLMNGIFNGNNLTCSRFIFLKGEIATLERAIGNFFINFLISKNFQEISVPLLLSEQSLFQSGHYPKEKENMFHIPDKNLYLIPTSECVLLNILNNQILKEKDLPIKYTAFNMNFRKEAGAAGKDTKGLIRLHQFPKVEMVAFTNEKEKENMFLHFLSNGEECLNLLKLPYRIVNLCSGDLGFNAEKTYDLEVWMAGSSEYREVSSISSCGIFQAKRLNLKYINENKEKIWINTLNGTCLAVGRILAAIMEYYYQEDKIIIPEVLVPYTKFKEIKLF